MINQIINTSPQDVQATNNEGTWSVNNFRDIRSNYEESVWVNKQQYLNNGYYTDKYLNPFAIDSDKDWKSLEIFREKYLQIRLFFSNFVNSENKARNIKLSLYFSLHTEQGSYR